MRGGAPGPPGGRRRPGRWHRPPRPARSGTPRRPAPRAARRPPKWASWPTSSCSRSRPTRAGTQRTRWRLPCRPVELPELVPRTTGTIRPWATSSVPHRAISPDPAQAGRRPRSPALAGADADQPPQGLGDGSRAGFGGRPGRERARRDGAPRRCWWRPPSRGAARGPPPWRPRRVRRPTPRSVPRPTKPAATAARPRWRRRPDPARPPGSGPRPGPQYPDRTRRRRGGRPAAPPRPRPPGAARRSRRRSGGAGPRQGGPVRRGGRPGPARAGRPTGRTRRAGRRRSHGSTGAGPQPTPTGQRPGRHALRPTPSHRRRRLPLLQKRTGPASSPLSRVVAHPCAPWASSADHRGRLQPSITTKRSRSSPGPLD